MSLLSSLCNELNVWKFFFNNSSLLFLLHNSSFPPSQSPFKVLLLLLSSNLLLLPAVARGRVMLILLLEFLLLRRENLKLTSTSIGVWGKIRCTLDSHIQGLIEFNTLNTNYSLITAHRNGFPYPSLWVDWWWEHVLWTLSKLHQNIPIEQLVVAVSIPRFHQ